ncbi:MAG: hypothetical protein RBS78_01005 [Coriobacteriia bacterium]|jgi:hypothetical protein|nr:hypothetical protein [Coriobacteriia bacterium]
MTDFRAGDPGSGNPGEQTNFAEGGGAGNQPGTQEDTTVVLEYGGKQYTKADLLKKLTNADSHIGTLTGELADQRELLNEVNDTLKKQISAADLLKQILEGKAPEAAPAPAAAPAAQEAPSADAIAAQVLGKLRESKDAEQRDANWAEVTKALTGAFGDKVNQKVAEVAAEAGLTLAEAAEMARSKPKAFMRLFPEVTAKPKPSVLPSSGQYNTQSFQATQRGLSGILTAKNTRELVDIYQARLREAGL